MSYSSKASPHPAVAGPTAPAPSFPRGPKHGRGGASMAIAIVGDDEPHPKNQGQPSSTMKNAKSPGGGGFLDLEPAASPIVDIGLNLCDKSFKASVPDIVRRALDKRVTRMVITGTSLKASEAGLEMANDVSLCHDTSTGERILWATAGVHPHGAKHWTPDTRSRLVELQRDPACVAVGECGLDFNRNFSPADVQESVFEEQVRLAVELGKPLFCHEREAHSKFIEVLARVPGLDMTRVCVHCFTGHRREVEAYVRMGFFIGFTGCICDEKRGKLLRELVPLVPLAQLMIETDAPYMLPTAGRGRNEPANLPAIIRTVAKCHGVSEEEAALITTQNAISFFGLR